METTLSVLMHPLLWMALALIFKGFASDVGDLEGLFKDAGTVCVGLAALFSDPPQLKMRRDLETPIHPVDSDRGVARRLHDHERQP